MLLCPIHAALQARAITNTYICMHLLIHRNRLTMSYYLYIISLHLVIAVIGCRWWGQCLLNTIDIACDSLSTHTAPHANVVSAGWFLVHNQTESKATYVELIEEIMA